jgi:hypothetical protein
LYKLAEQLTSLGYSVIVCNNAEPLHSLKPLVNNPIKSLAMFKAFARPYNCISILVDSYIVLDVDSKEQIAELKRLSNKYNVKSNLVVKTKRGYHVYYAINYDVFAQNGSNDKIAIKCKCMPITAPGAYRADKQFAYKVVNNSLPRKEDLVLLPQSMYKEIQMFNKAKEEAKEEMPSLRSDKPFISASPTAAQGFRDKNNLQCSGLRTYSDKPISFYLEKLDTSRYLFGDMGSWLYILACCKQADPASELDVFNWTRQGKYSDMGEKEFKNFWTFADAQKVGIMKPFAVLESLIKK